MEQADQGRRAKSEGVARRWQEQERKFNFLTLRSTRIKAHLQGAVEILADALAGYRDSQGEEEIEYAGRVEAALKGLGVAIGESREKLTNEDHIKEYHHPSPWLSAEHDLNREWRAHVKQGENLQWREVGWTLDKLSKLSGGEPKRLNEPLRTPRQKLNELQDTGPVKVLSLGVGYGRQLQSVVNTYDEGAMARLRVMKEQLEKEGIACTEPKAYAPQRFRGSHNIRDRFHWALKTKGDGETVGENDIRIDIILREKNLGELDWRICASKIGMDRVVAWGQESTQFSPFGQAYDAEKSWRRGVGNNDASVVAAVVLELMGVGKDGMPELKPSSSEPHPASMGISLSIGRPAHVQRDGHMRQALEEARVERQRRQEQERRAQEQERLRQEQRQMGISHSRGRSISM